jgi:hypothetical protein
LPAREEVHASAIRYETGIDLDEAHGVEGIVNCDQFDNRRISRSLADCSVIKL